SQGFLRKRFTHFEHEAGRRRPAHPAPGLHLLVVPEHSRPTASAWAAELKDPLPEELQQPFSRFRILTLLRDDFELAQKAHGLPCVKVLAVLQDGVCDVLRTHVDSTAE